MDAFDALPGGDLVSQGVADLRAGRESLPALLVSIGAPRLRALGVDVPAPLHEPEHRLYARLHEVHADAAHSRFNALVRRLVSFERAMATADALRTGYDDIADKLYRYPAVDPAAFRRAVEDATGGPW